MIEEEGSFKNGAWVKRELTQYEKDIEAWRNDILSDPVFVRDFMEECTGARMFDDVFSGMRISTEMMWHMITPDENKNGVSYTVVIENDN